MTSNTTPTSARSAFIEFRLNNNALESICGFMIVVAAACLVFSTGKAQIVNVESMRIQTDSIRFVLNSDLKCELLSNNDSKFLSIASSTTTQLKSKSLKDIFLFNLAADFSKLNEEDISNAFLFHARYNRKISPFLRMEVFTQAQTNRVLNIQLRQLNGIGPRFKLMVKDHFKSYVGILYMLENQRFYGAGETLQTKHRLSSYLSLVLRHPSSSAELSTVTYYQPRIDQFSDFRLSNQSTLNLRITSKLSMTNALNLYYESNPAQTVANFNYLFENGIRLTL